MHKLPSKKYKILFGEKEVCVWKIGLFGIAAQFSLSSNFEVRGDKMQCRRRWMKVYLR